MRELWTEKYRPTVTADYVFRDETQKGQVAAWVQNKAIPHLLLSGVQGTGKTTLAKLLFNELDVHPFDVKEINGSKDNGVDYIRDTVNGFCETIPYGEFKYILLDEADYLSLNAQAVLRNAMERFANTVRFVITCNYPHKIMPAIHSRCQGFHIEKLDKTEFTSRIATILITEEIDLDIDTLDLFVNATYPDMRKCINNCQMHSQTGTLTTPSADDATDSDYKLNMVALFKAGKYKEARELICTQITQEEYEDMFRFMYENLNLWAGEDEDKEAEAILVVRNGLVKHVACGDPEINLSATFCELEILARS